MSGPPTPQLPEKTQHSHRHTPSMLLQSALARCLWALALCAVLAAALIWATRPLASV